MTRRRMPICGVLDLLARSHQILLQQKFTVD